MTSRCVQMTSTIISMASSMYTLYYIHPFIPYGIIWRRGIVPLFYYMKSPKKEDHVCYELIMETVDEKTGKTVLVVKERQIPNDNDI